MKSIEISARTVAEAIQLALAQLGKDRDEVAIEVLEAGSEDEEALVRVTAVDDEEETAPESLAPPTADNMDQIARRILEDLLERMDIEGYVTAVHSTVPGQKGEPEDTITLHVEGADEEAMGLLIGRRRDHPDVSAQAVSSQRGIQRRAARSCGSIGQHVTREMAEHEIIWLGHKIKS